MASKYLQESVELHSLLIQEAKRRLFDESVPRILQCLEGMTEEQIWYRTNVHTNSVGNLVLHLCGNVRQWLISGLGGKLDTRQRSTEFDPESQVSKVVLIERLLHLEEMAVETLDALTPEQWMQPYHIQGFQETGLSVLIHVLEHFSYHTGQITYIHKSLNNLSTDYYDEREL